MIKFHLRVPHKDHAMSNVLALSLYTQQLVQIVELFGPTVVYVVSNNKSNNEIMELFYVQAQKHMGRLMGKGGKRITGISYVTGCTISVPKFKDRPPEEPVEILVYGENQSSLAEAVRLIANCFEEE